MRLPKVFDLYFDCKTEQDLQREYEYLLREKKRLENLIRLAKQHNVKLKLK